MLCRYCTMVPGRFRSVCRTLPCILAAVLLQGCVVQDIHRELVATRQSVQRIEALAPVLEQTKTAIDRSNEHMERLTSMLATFQTTLDLVLARVDDTNVHLNESAAHLRGLAPMMASLRSLNESLAALRRMVENIDKAVPLLNLSSGTPPVDGALNRRDREQHAPSTSSEPPPK